MGLFDFIFSSKKKEQERLRQEEEARRQKLEQEQIVRDREHRLEENRRKERLCQERLQAERNKTQIGKPDAYLAVFSASWCGPSKRFLKEIQEGGITNYTLIDTDKEELLTEKFSIRSVPTTLLLDKDENIINKWVGYEDDDPGQTLFVNHIKSSPYNIHPYSELLRAKQPNKQAPDMNNNRQSIIGAEIKEDLRTKFYELEDIKSRSMGGDLMLAPYDAQAYFTYPDASLLPALANTEKIKRFLPGLGFNDEESTKKRLKGFMMKTEAQLGVTYVIRSSNIPVGMVMVNSPLYNKRTLNLAIWTVDFYISDLLEHKGVMFAALVRVLNEMKTAMGAKEVYATVDKDNEDCKCLLGKGLFTLIDNTGFKNRDESSEPPLVYMIDLSTIRFERR